MSRFLPLLLLTTATLAFAQDSHTVDLYKIRARESGEPKEFSEDLAQFAELLKELRWRVFTLIEKVSQTIELGEEVEFPLQDDLVLGVKLIEKFAAKDEDDCVIFRVEVHLWDKETEETVIKVRMRMRMASPVLMNTPSPPERSDRLLLGLEIQ